jgi:hypothetical protein
MQPLDCISTENVGARGKFSRLTCTHADLASTRLTLAKRETATTGLQKKVALATSRLLHSH